MCVEQGYLLTDMRRHGEEVREMRLKDITVMNALTLPETTPGDYTFRYIDIGSVDGDGNVTLDVPIQFYGAPSRARRIVKRNDVLISTVRTYLKAIAPVDFDAANIIASTGFAVCTPKYGTNPRYLAYAVRSDGVINEICKESSGISYPAINATMLSAITIPYCDAGLQRQIVAYLDEKSAAIDARVAVLEKKLAADKRLKASVINRAVTRGLNPKAKLKDSGVDWIGKIPVGWDMRRVKDIANPLQYGASEVGLEYDPDLPRYIRITDITQDGELRTDGAQSLAEEVARPYMLRDGDILLARSGATVGKAFVYRVKYGRGAFAGYMIRCRVIPDCAEFRFVYYWMLSSNYQAWKQRAISQATIQNICAEKYANLTVPLPSLAEQRAIADYLDAECAKIDKMSELVTREIELYRKLKRSLVNEVVTGKRTVFADKPLRRGKVVA